MLRLFHAPGDREPMRLRPAEELDAARSEAGWIWLDIVDPTPELVDALGEQFALNPLSLADVLDERLFPKVDHYDDHVFVVLHGVVTGEDRLDTRELDVFIGRDYVITVHSGEVAAIDIIAGQVAGNAALAGLGPAAFAALIAEVGSRRYFPLLDSLDERIEQVEELALSGDSRTLTETQALRRDVILLRRILGPQREVLRELAQPAVVLDERGRRAFTDAYDVHFRLVESLDSARALLAGALESYRGAMAERTNEVMKVLTVFSAILLPLSLVAGIYGMNFADLPGDGWEWGFLALLGAMAVVAVGLWLYFARRGFVGGPKLRDLPKAVGLGLVHIGTAPIRGVVGTIGRLVPTEVRLPGIGDTGPGAEAPEQDEPADDQEHWGDG